MSKQSISAYFDSVALKRDFWRKKNRYYHDSLDSLVKFLVTEGSRVLDIGSGTGELLAKLKSSRGVGIDLSKEMVEIAKNKFPHLDFKVQDAHELDLKEKFDYVIICNSLGLFEDVWKVFRNLRKVTVPESRVIIFYYNALWEPAIKIAEKLGLRMPVPYQNWLSQKDIQDFLYLNGYEIIKSENKILLPVYIPVVSWLLNKILINLPLLWRLSLVQYVVARQVPLEEQKLTCSVVVPCRNEVGNIDSLVGRLPQMGVHTELIFVDGYSTDGTVEKIEQAIRAYKDKLDIKLIHQIPRYDQQLIKDNLIKANKMLRLGKADAVHKGFDAAKGEVLMVLDADCTVPPEDLPKFYLAIAESRGDLINGTRLVYPLEKGAMRILNLYANEFFGMVFTWLLGQHIKDTLCGTKVLSKRSFAKIKETREYFGNFDPFGDFELLFGSIKQNLKIIELPVRYKARISGDIKIQRFRHGILLLQMCYLAFLRFKLRQNVKK